MEDDDPFEKARQEVSAHAEMFRERFLATELALWAALISLSGVFISAASVVATVGKPTDFACFCLIGCIITATLSMVLIVKNFQARRSMYRFLGKPPPAEVWNDKAAFATYVESSRKKKEEMIRDQTQCERCEKIVYCCLTLSGIFLVVGAYIARLSS